MLFFDKYRFNLAKSRQIVSSRTLSNKPELDIAPVGVNKEFLSSYFLTAGQFRTSGLKSIFGAMKNQTKKANYKKCQIFRYIAKSDCSKQFSNCLSSLNLKPMRFS